MTTDPADDILELADPTDTLRQWAEYIDWRSTRIVLSIGLTISRPWELLRQYRPDLIVLVYEPDPATAAAGEKLTPDGRVVVTSDLVHLRALLTIHYQLGWHVETVGDDQLSEHGPGVKRALDEAMRFCRVNEMTSRSNAARWCDIGLAQLPYLVDRPHLAGMPKCLAGIPGVVVGAGPSLDRNIETLRKIADRVAVIAVNSAIGALERVGIVPDMVVALEQQGLSLAPVMHSRAMAESVLVPGIHVWPGIWAAKTTHILPALQTVGPVGVWLSRHFGIRSITNGGSVSTLAYRVAELLGCAPIVLVGCDCARGGDGGVVYAAGVGHGSHRRSVDQSNVHHVPAWGGSGTAPTTVGLSTYREWFESAARGSLARGGPRHINATEGGAHIERWEELPLSDVPLPSEPVGAFLRLLDGMERAQVLDRRMVLRMLHAELRSGAVAAELARDLARQLERVESGLREAISVFEHSELLAAAAAPQVDDVGTLVSYEHLASSAIVQRRVASAWPRVESAIRQAIEEIHRD